MTVPRTKTYFEALCLLHLQFHFLFISAAKPASLFCLHSRPLYTGSAIQLMFQHQASLEPASCRLRRRRPANAALVATTRAQPLLSAECDFAIELVRRLLAVNKVTEAAAHAPFARVEAAACFAEVGDGAEFAVDRARGVPAAIELVAGLLGRVFVFEPCVDVADEVCRGGIGLAKNREGTQGEGVAYDRCCCRRRQAPRAHRTCRARTRCPRRRPRSGSAAATGSCGSWGRVRDSGTGSA